MLVCSLGRRNTCQSGGCSCGCAVREFERCPPCSREGASLVPGSVAGQLCGDSSRFGDVRCVPRSTGVPFPSSAREHRVATGFLASEAARFYYVLAAKMPGKRPSSAKMEWKIITPDIKLEVLRRFEVGEKLGQIAKALGLTVSTVTTIRDDKEKNEFTNSYSFESLSVDSPSECSHGDHRTIVACVA